MRLLHKVSLQYLILVLATLAGIGCLLYFWLQRQLVAEMQEQLDLEIGIIKEELAHGRQVSFPLVRVTPAPASVQPTIVYGDTLITDAIQGKRVAYYYLRKTEPIHGINHRIEVMTAYIGWKAYARIIFMVFMAIACSLMLFGFLLNYYINKRIWRPFFENLTLFKHFSIKSTKATVWSPSTITEFAILKDTLQEMTEQSKKDYIDLREFTENVYHEFQTPVAIMRTVLEKLSQGSFDAATASLLVDGQRAVDRLSKVNRKLFILAKLENNYFVDKQAVNLTALIKEKVDLMGDLFSQKNINLTCQLEEELIVQSDPFMAETLILNLLSNMLRYTRPKKQAYIMLSQQTLSFANEGDTLPFPVEHIFERFKKPASRGQSIGLGLAIAKQICEVNHWQLNYLYEAGKHCLNIKLSYV